MPALLPGSSHLFDKDLFCLRGRFPSLPSVLQYYTMILALQRIIIIVGDAGFEPKTSAPEVWCATNEPPHLLRILGLPKIVGEK